ncbi:MAG TPA: hypothetical protein VF353_09790 [Candidatus Binatia bacterium]
MPSDLKYSYRRAANSVYDWAIPEGASHDDHVRSAAAMNDPSAAAPRAPELPAGAQWLNAAAPLRLADLRGAWVLLDFWSYG